jgi:LPS-assembly protein
LGVGQGCRLGRALVICALVLLLASRPAVAQYEDLQSDQPALINADEIVYDDTLGTVTARGNVEISQEDRVLLADSVTYNIRSKVVSAAGNVSLSTPDGNTVFADYVELTDDLKEGFIRNIRLLMADNSRVAATTGTRTNGSDTVFNQAVFSPCDLCREDPTRAPLWQLRADKVIHDGENRRVRYRHARFELFGVPLLYTPYFAHPDPTVERESGFLAPGYGFSSFQGYYFEAPYFWAYAPNADLTVTPRVMTDQGLQLFGEFRRLFENGYLEIEASGTQGDRENRDGTTDKDRFRGHIDAFGRYHIDETWRIGFDFQQTSDDTYLRSYDISSASHLTSRVFAEAFEGRNYASANAFHYQTLREDEVDDEQPILTPLIDLNYISEPIHLGGYVSADASFMVLTREEGRDSTRLATRVAWTLPYTGPLGDLYSLTTSLEADGYLTDGVDPDSPSVNPDDPQGSDTTGRLFPQMSLFWRYPWISMDGDFQQIIEPMVQLVIGPNSGNSGSIPNEDSQAFEFDDTNLFSLNRFPGVDRVSSGQRIDYGLKYNLNTGDGFHSQAFIGQSYQFNEDLTFPTGTGLEDQASDFVGRVYAQPMEELDLAVHFRLDHETLALEASELELRAGVPALTVTTNYLLSEAVPESGDIEDREEITFGVESALTSHWNTFGWITYDLEESDLRSAEIGVLYQDECFLIETSYQRKNFRDRELEPEDILFIRVVPKLLGEFETKG